MINSSLPKSTVENNYNKTEVLDQNPNEPPQMSLRVPESI